MSTGYDAWNTPGWDVQNPVYLSATDSSVELPDGVRPVKITGSYVGPAGGAYGMVRFTPKTANLQVNNIEVLLAPVRVEVRNGELDVTLTVLPVDVVWEVREAVGPVRQVYDVVLTATATDTDIALLTRVDPDGLEPSVELFTGHGPPGVIPGAEVGDEYLDVDTGLLYRLD